jgi:ATP-binding cassette subfamily F protein 1
MDTYNFIYENYTLNLNNISINNFNLSVGSNNLFDNAQLTLSKGQIYGLIGKNGYGKTSLLKQIIPLCTNDKIKILYVEQELILDKRVPLQFILDSDIKLKYYQDKIILLQNELEKDNIEFDQTIYEELIETQNNLNSFNPEKEESKVHKILDGLGFIKEMLNQPSNLFSGGWQMRLSLARALYLEPDILLLDEPTNHLDLEAIIWLGDYLQNWKNIAVVISHNIGFLDSVCTFILNIENKKLISYKGNYFKFKKAYYQKNIEIKKEYEKYEKKLKDAKKKGLTKAQSDEFIKKNIVIRPEKEYDIKIEFFDIPKYNSNVIKINNISFSYENNLILDDISLGIGMNSRITLLGLNGCGKSTLIKLIKEELKPTKGEILIQNGIKIGYYNQHFGQHLPLNKNPLEYLEEFVPNTDLFNKKMTKHEIIRKYLGKIKLESNSHTKLIKELSGGQKARVAFIKLIFEKPQILLLDEPTNHLDIETVETLIDSLKTFNGGLLLITHEPELIKQLSNEIWVLNKETHKIITNIEDYEEYCNHIINNKD